MLNAKQYEEIMYIVSMIELEREWIRENGDGGG